MQVGSKKTSVKLVRYDVSEMSDEEDEETAGKSQQSTAVESRETDSNPRLKMTPEQKFTAFKKGREDKKTEGEVSKNVVDDFFKDFIASKMKQIESDYQKNDKPNESEVASSVEEMSKYLDAEITHINCEAAPVSTGGTVPATSSSTTVQASSVTGFKPVSSASDSKSTSKPEPKKLGFKNFGIKLSLTSAELIQSGEIFKGGKRLEEGEVMSSHSEGTDSESGDADETDNEVSGTGSISDSDKDGKASKSKKKKKKKKHKHKKKKKHKDKSKEKTKKDGEGCSEKSSKRKHSHKSRSRSRSPKKSKKSRSSRSRSRERRRKKSRSRTPSPDRFWRSKYGDFDAYLYQKRAAQEARARHRRGRSRSRSRSKSRERGVTKEREKESKRMADLRLKIDKAKLREIAMKNAIANAMSGSGPQLDVALKAGGKSVEELTDFCKRIASKDKGKGPLLDDSSSEEEGQTGGRSDEEDGLIHHPFKMKEQSSIVMDIKNAKQLPTATPGERLVQSATLRIQFPVSSGSQHRMKEWVPVEKTPPVSTAPTPPSTGPAAPKPATTAAPIAGPSTASNLPAPPLPVAPVRPEDRVFEEPPAQPIDISAIVSERLQAVRKLQENPTDFAARSVLNSAQKQASLWAASKQLPGQFLGSTGATVLSHDELIGPNKRRQAWAKKEQLINAAPLTGGIGMFLLQKMGWKQGTGLGKNNEGNVEPLMLDVKIDRKGLSSQGEGSKRGGGGGGGGGGGRTAASTVKDLSGKHPVSALVELCNKRKWLPPQFDVVHESGPDHKKNFLFKVRVNNTDYQSAVASNNKKLAKAQAATVCLQEMGLVPR